MRKLNTILVGCLIYLFTTAMIVSANVVTFYFDASGDLADSVYGFQFNYELSDGSLLSNDQLHVHYTDVMTSSGPVMGDGAVPGTDLSIFGRAPGTDWHISIMNNASTGGTNTILGYTLGDEPLESGIIFDLTIPDNIELFITETILANYNGTPGFFAGKFRMGHHDHHFKVEPSAPVPLPPSALLLMAGLVGMATIKRKNN